MQPPAISRYLPLSLSIPALDSIVQHSRRLHFLDTRSGHVGFGPLTFRFMKLLDYTQESGLLPALECRDRTEAIRRLVAGLVASGTVAEPDLLVEEILLREQEGSTAIGGGLSIPHARFRSVQRVQLAVATLTTPLEILSEDGRPVDVIILIVGPVGDPRQMLRVLARLARLVKQGTFLDDLRAASTPAGMLEVIGAAEGRYA